LFFKIVNKANSSLEETVPLAQFTGKLHKAQCAYLMIAKCEFDNQSLVIDGKPNLHSTQYPVLDGSTNKPQQVPQQTATSTDGAPKKPSIGMTAISACDHFLCTKRASKMTSC
jgi:hypothetical protein